jgi:hypothetical protein
MPTGRGDSSFSGNFNAPVVVGSHVRGDVRSEGDFVQLAPDPAAAAGLLAQLGELRAKVEGLIGEAPEAEGALGSIDDLTADAEAARGGQDPEPAAARGHWGRIRSLLGGATQVTADLAKIGQSVAQVFGGG